jgi:hypothetical protein
LESSLPFLAKPLLRGTPRSSDDTHNRLGIGVDVAFAELTEEELVKVGLDADQ